VSLIGHNKNDANWVFIEYVSGGRRPAYALNTECKAFALPTNLENYDTNIKLRFQNMLYKHQ